MGGVPDLHECRIALLLLTPVKSEKPSISSTTIHDPGNCGKRKGSKEGAVMLKSEVLDPSLGMIV